MEKELEEYGLTMRENDSPNREKIDFFIEDGDGHECLVWGDTPEDVDWDCDHPVEPDYDDDETVGECPICGATCEWHWETNYDDGYAAKDRVVHSWRRPEKLGGIVGKYLENYNA